MADYWNHNVYYQPLILGAVPPGCGSALDVGCGDGLLACRLAERCRDVTGVDRDHTMIALARERASAIMAWSRSTPVTSWHRSASRQASSPSPQPTSSALPQPGGTAPRMSGW